jgi:hypothetical protein
MKHTTLGLAALCSLVCLIFEAPAYARAIRADLSCPFGGGAPGTWSYEGPVATSQFNPGIDTSNSAMFAGSPSDNGGPSFLSVTGATMYAWYSLPIPSATSCGVPGFIAPSPAAQVITYDLASGDTLSSSDGKSPVTLPDGSKEVQFNYAVSGAGMASFTMNKITYKSTGTALPSNTANDFIFNSDGSLFGAISDDGTFVNVAGGSVTGLPSGWTSSGTVSAPEIDPASAIGAFTLLAGCLAVLRGGRRTLYIEEA